MSKRLYRSKKNKMLLGVLGGIAEYLGVDPTIIRILYILLCLFYPVFLLAYFLMAIVMPEAPETFVQEESGKDVKDGGKLLGVILVFIGVALIAKNIFPMTLLGMREIGAVLLILLGLYLLIRHWPH